MDATFINEVANHPEVRPFIGGEGPLDLGPTCLNPANFVLLAEHGGWLLHPKAPGTYELHTLFLPEGRGKAYFVAAIEALRWVFTRTDCVEIFTQVPDDNGGARMAAKIVGFRERFRREGAWEPGVGISYQFLSVDDWLARDAECLAQGRAFHDALEVAKVAAGSTLPIHPEDQAHDRAVGAAALMVQTGQTAKGVAIYNRWALFAGYASIEALGPTTIDVRDAVLEIADGAFSVLLVRGLPPHE